MSDDVERGRTGWAYPRTESNERSASPIQGPATVGAAFVATLVFGLTSMEFVLHAIWTGGVPRVADILDGVLWNISLVGSLGVVLGTVVALRWPEGGIRSRFAAGIGAGAALAALAGLLDVGPIVQWGPGNPDFLQFAAFHTIGRGALLVVAVVTTSWLVTIFVGERDAQAVRRGGDADSPRVVTDSADSHESRFARSLPLLFGAGVVLAIGVATAANEIAEILVYGQGSIGSMGGGIASGFTVGPGLRTDGPYTGFTPRFLVRSPAMLVGLVAGVARQWRDRWKPVAGVGVAYVLVLLPVKLLFLGPSPPPLGVALRHAGIIAAGMSALAGTVAYATGAIVPNGLRAGIDVRTLGSPNRTWSRFTGVTVALFTGVFALGVLPYVAEALMVKLTDQIPSPTAELFYKSVEIPLTTAALPLAVLAGVVYALVSRMERNRLALTATVGAVVGYLIVSGGVLVAGWIVPTDPGSSLVSVIELVEPIVGVALVAGVSAVLTATVLRTGLPSGTRNRPDE